MNSHFKTLSALKENPGQGTSAWRTALLVFSFHPQTRTANQSHAATLTSSQASDAFRRAERQRGVQAATGISAIASPLHTHSYAGDTLLVPECGN